jgi:hypothetical protein
MGAATRAILKGRRRVKVARLRGVDFDRETRRRAVQDKTAGAMRRFLESIHPNQETCDEPETK